MRPRGVCRKGGVILNAGFEDHVIVYCVCDGGCGGVLGGGGGGAGFSSHCLHLHRSLRGAMGGTR